MKKMEKTKKGIFLSLVLIFAFVTFVGDILLGVVSLFFSTALDMLSFLSDETNNASSTLGSLLHLVSGLGGTYGVIKSWKLQKNGLFILVGAMVLSLVGASVSFAIPYLLFAIYGTWLLIIGLNFKKFK